jgi:hypothetical protein
VEEREWWIVWWLGCLGGVGGGGICLDDLDGEF